MHSSPQPLWRIIIAGVTDGILDLIDIAWIPAIVALSVSHLVAHDEYAKAAGSFAFWALVFVGLRLNRIERRIK